MLIRLQDTEMHVDAYHLDSILFEKWDDINW